MKKNKLCMILYKLCIKLSVLKSSLPEAFSKKDAPQTWSKPTGEEPYYRSTISTNVCCGLWGSISGWV